jgi:hypothetical protein
VDQRPLLSYREKKTIMKRRNTYLLFALTPPLLAFALAGTFPLDNRDYYTRITATLARELPREHLSRRELNDGIVRQFVQNYITSLDFERIYFHAEDIAGFDARAKTLRQQLLDGDNSFAFLVYETFKQRLQNRIAYIDAVLAEGFDFDVEEEYRWKRRDAPGAQMRMNGTSSGDSASRTSICASCCWSRARTAKQIITMPPYSSKKTATHHPMGMQSLRRGMTQTRRMRRNSRPRNYHRQNLSRIATSSTSM